MRTFGKIIKYTLFCLIGLFTLFLSALLLFEQPIPDFLLRRITRDLSTPDYLVRADSASFRFSHGRKRRAIRYASRDRKGNCLHPYGLAQKDVERRRQGHSQILEQRFCLVL